ncbi:stress response NST1-like protein [Actinidia rufa]|uniref:Stress response NST1-like protein n=1 Tax=Actinidia rufa TaxID=165716 RepID=A0A7J0GSM2_9ERIC|nr:stress response NST1-like protein [Actinidia rufa]
MLLLRHDNGGPQSTELDLLSPSHGDKFGAGESPHLIAEIDSKCSTPYVSATSSPERGPSGYFFSAPASPMHFVLSTASYSSSAKPTDFFSTVSGSFEFEFSSKFSPNDSSAGNGSMSSADELVLKRSLHKKARSMSPLRSAQFQWHDEKAIDGEDASLEVSENKQAGTSSIETPPSGSASSSRSSSSGRNSKKWIFLKDLLYRSKSEGRCNNKEKFWSSITFSSSGKEKKLISPSLTPSSSEKEKIREETERQKRNE